MVIIGKNSKQGNTWLKCLHVFCLSLCYIVNWKHMPDSTLPWTGTAVLGFCCSSASAAMACCCCCCCWAGLGTSVLGGTAGAEPGLEWAAAARLWSEEMDSCIYISMLHSSLSNRDTPSVNKIGEREHYIHSQYLVPRICVRIYEWCCPVVRSMQATFKCKSL